MAYTISEKGSDLTTINFKDVNGQDLPDKIPKVKQGSLSWMPNNKGIFYSKYIQTKKHSTNESTITRKDEYHTLFYHPLGSKQDILIADFRELDDPNLNIVGSVSRDGRFLFVYVYDRDNANTIYYLDLNSINFKIHRRPPLTLLIHDTRAFFVILDYDHETESAIVLTDHSAPNRKLIRIKITTAMLGCAHWETLIAEDPKRALESVVPVAGDKLMVIYIEDVKTFLYVHCYKTGKLLYKIPLGIGTVSQCYGDREDTEAFFSFNSFLEAPTIYRADFSLVAKTSLLQLEQIPIFIIARKDVKRNGQNPTLLYGYGGFNIPVLPSYSSHRNIFVKLAIQGGSNGGLLVAACSHQRPELFGAVINQVGVMDMLRFHKFTVGSFWISEYGDPEKSSEFEYIFRYSPLHNIRLPRGVQWPATLLITGDHDDRVVPSHTLKYAAQLYHYIKKSEIKLIQRNPILVNIETNTGHGAGKPRDKIIEELVDIMSFLQRVLQLKCFTYGRLNVQFILNISANDFLQICIFAQFFSFPHSTIIFLK
uniref:Prolyl endopeptidase n=1 Tax=Meloidogyne incognita TaxID=6306 RepID=A0A914LIL2_MELIC